MCCRRSASSSHSRTFDRIVFIHAAARGQAGGGAVVAATHPLPPEAGEGTRAFGGVWNLEHEALASLCTHAGEAPAVQSARLKARGPNFGGPRSVVFHDVDQYFAFAGGVGFGDDAGLFHALDQRGRAIVADLQTALQVAR